MLEISSCVNSFCRSDLSLFLWSGMNCNAMQWSVMCCKLPVATPCTKIIRIQVSRVDQMLPLANSLSYVSSNQLPDSYIGCIYLTSPLWIRCVLGRGVLGAGQWVPVVCPMGRIQGGGRNPPAEGLFPSHPQLSFLSSTDRNPAILKLAGFWWGMII